MIPEAGSRSEFKQEVLRCKLDRPLPGERYLVRAAMLYGRFGQEVPRLNACVTINEVSTFVSFVGSDFLITDTNWQEMVDDRQVLFIGYDP